MAWVGGDGMAGGLAIRVSLAGFFKMLGGELARRVLGSLKRYVRTVWIVGKSRIGTSQKP